LPTGNCTAHASAGISACPRLWPAPYSLRLQRDRRARDKLVSNWLYLRSPISPAGSAKNCRWRPIRGPRIGSSTSAGLNWGLWRRSGLNHASGAHRKASIESQYPKRRCSERPSYREAFPPVSDRHLY